MGWGESFAFHFAEFQAGLYKGFYEFFQTFFAYNFYRGEVYGVAAFYAFITALVDDFLFFGFLLGY